MLGKAGKSTVENAVGPAPLRAASAVADPAHVSTAHGSASPAEAATAVRSGAAGPPASPLRSANPYAKLDEAAAPTLVHASAQRVAVSVRDPVLGELQVRAQAVSSQVQASLATGSAAGHAQLSGQLPSLANFLAEQRVAVTRLSVDRELVREGDRQTGGSNSGTSPEAGNGGQPSGSPGGAPGPGGLPVAPGAAAAEAGADAGGGPGTDRGAGLGAGPGAGLGPASRDGGISWNYIDVHA
jgi:hypothetical protein